MQWTGLRRLGRYISLDQMAVGIRDAFLGFLMFFPWRWDAAALFISWGKQSRISKFLVLGTSSTIWLGVPITSSHPHHGIGLKISSEKDMLGFAGLHQHHQQSTYQFVSPWDPPHTCKVSNVSSHHELPRLCHAKSCQPEEIHIDVHPELEEFVAPKSSILPAERCKLPRNSYLSWTESWNWTPSRTGTTGIYCLAMGRCAGHAS